MKLTSMTISLLPLIAGCTSATVIPSFDYASTTLGVYNSGLLNVGQLFVWDTKANTLTRLDEVPFPSHPSNKSIPTTLIASKISSVSFNVGLDATVKASASAAIKDNVSIEVQNGSREEYGSTITLISNEIVRKRNAGEDVDRAWLLKPAAQPGSALAYVLVRGIVISDKAQLVARNSVGGKLQLEVPGKKGATATIDLSKESLASCAGSKSPCFLSFQVLRAYINERGNYDFEPVRGVSNTQIGDLLKTL
ncbi:hypothetical protein [Rhizobium leguminosarum]|uniref:hypothetical protein n=1 Tax=Rhizobium leguminosarum TaxID=384 RepID=UPI00103BA23E|nr:hypothetical protein [Rhizobium leguminosarum]MBY5651791.1 hypothetical protein [Rhizobium leguminosarum]TBZ06252.1 hypothetical protein E0H38_33095 [Rhizobium leguminosarum bv. viciae]